MEQQMNDHADLIYDLKKQEKKNFSLVDNTVKIEVDHGVLRTWEVFVLEDEDSTMVHLGMVLAKYLANGSGLISPGLPIGSVGELSREEQKEIKRSKAYRRIGEMPLEELKNTATAFATAAKEQLSPN